ncbi:pentatricopeptide repeat (PPR) superfamily protein [Actinidia rufa]|uniref:Pentatricopeptide repeat (PPR) superfamily protein n=1 Tax=Actinidia rufa TaxID=165716 RepID=A0A7J0FHR8_9ERIC|nr:pentatricopeptide repeat (PPR) superfamily protein [Actinidia rufa]
MTGLSSSKSQLGLKISSLGQAIHGFLAKSGYRNDVFRGNNLVSMYVKFSRLEDAHRVFDEMLERNAITWTTIMNGYSQISDVESVARMTRCMRKCNEELNEHTCSVILRACESPDEKICGEQIHGFVVKCGFCENVFVGTSLVSMYSRSGHLNEAEKLFNELMYKDVRCLNFMISEYGNAGYGEKAVWVFLELLHTGLEPNDYTFTNVISACYGAVGLKEGRQLHGLAMKHGLMGKTSVRNAIITMYGRHGSVEEAESMFREMGDRNLVSWTALLSLYVKKWLRFTMPLLECKDLNLGVQIHGFVIKLGVVSDVNVGTALIDLYAKCKDLQSARLLLDNLSVINTASFNAILTGFAKIDGEDNEHAMILFNQLRLTELKPDSVTFACLLSSSADLACLVRGTSLHAYAIKAGFEGDLTVSNAVITMYAKCGSILDAHQMFTGMKEHDSISWNAMVSAHCPPRSSYSGFWNYGVSLFNEMELKYGVSPILEHFACLVDLLGRAGLFSEAMDIINKSPFSETHHYFGELWSMFVSFVGISILAKVASQRLLDLAPKEAGSYILVSNMYAREGMFNDAARVRTIMNDLKMSKEAGCSWIEIDNKTHQFVASSKDHLESDDIYAKLDLLWVEMKNIAGDGSDILIWDPI